MASLAMLQIQQSRRTSYSKSRRLTLSNILQNTDTAEDDEEQLTPDGFEKLQEHESGEDDEADACRTRPTDDSSIADDDTDVEPPEWELGIRRSSRSQGTDIDDLTLSDIILDPGGNVAYYWLGLVCMSVIYNIAVIVLRLAFGEMREAVIQDSVFYFLDTISDLIYIIDIVVHLRMSFYEDGCLVLNPEKIVEHFIQQRKFVLDLVAVIPLGTISSFIVGIGKLVFPTPFKGDLHILLARIPRLLKYPAMVKFFDLTDSRTRNPNWIRAFKLSLNLWIVIHWIGCIYYMLSEYEGLGTNDWVYPNGTKFNTFSRKYIRVMYWSLMTLTTIGERPAPETDLEFVFTGFTFLIGVFVFAAVVGNVGDVISNMNAARQDFQARMDQIKFYLQHRGVPEKLQNRVKRWADYSWGRTQAIDEPTLLQMLPDRLRTEIAINVHLETLKKVKIFEECEEGLLRELVLKLRPQIYSPGDYICRIGEIGREMFIVNHGKVEILITKTQSSRRTVIATLNPGNYFGEISLLKLDDGQNRRTADVRSIGYSELLRLSRKDLMSALVEYPNAKKILESQAKERMKETKEVTKTVKDDSPSKEAAPNEKPIKRKDFLLQVIKSQNFRKLISSKNSEVTEIQHILEELRSFHSQATKERVDHLTLEKEELQKQLRRKTTELKRAKRMIEKLLAKDRFNMLKSRGNMKPNGHDYCTRQTAIGQEGAEIYVKYNSTQQIDTGGEKDVCRNRPSSSVNGDNIDRNGDNIDKGNVPVSPPILPNRVTDKVDSRCPSNGDAASSKAVDQKDNNSSHCDSRSPKCVSAHVPEAPVLSAEAPTLLDSPPGINVTDATGAMVTIEANPTDDIINSLMDMDFECGGLSSDHDSSSSDNSDTDHSDLEFDYTDGS